MQTATNPQTGEKLVLQNGQWVPAGPSTPSGPVYGPPPSAPKPAGPPSGYRPTETGDLEFIPGGPADPAAKPPGQRSATEIEIAEKKASAQKRANTINAITGEVKRLYQQDIKGQPLSRAFGATEYIDTIPANDRFRAAGNTILPLIRPLVAQTAKEGDSDKEMEVFLSYVPSNDDADITIEQKFKMLDLLVGGMVDGRPPSETLMGIQSGQQAAPMSGGMAEQPTQSRNLAEIEAPSGDQMVRSQGTQTITNPELAGVRGEYLRRLESGHGPGEIIQFLRSAGVTDPKVLQSAVQQVQFRRQNPNVPIANYNTTALDQMDVPLSATESMLNEAAQSPVGAYAMNAGQTASMGLLDEAAGAMGGNAERVNIALQDSQHTNPIASTLGQISGSVMGALGGEAALASRGMAAGVPRALLADVGYGAASGAGMADEGNRLGGALTGAAAAGAGSLGGQALVRGAGSVISPTGGKLSDLYQAGVRPTPGQRMIAAGDGRGLSGLVGRVVGTTEEAIGSVPIIGAGIRGARQEAKDQFQIGAYNEMLKELKGIEGVPDALPKGMRPGTEPYRFAKEAVGDVYDRARSGMQIAPDGDLAADIATLRSSVDNLPDPSVKRFEKIVENTIMRRTGATVDGESFKKIQSDLGKIIRGIRKSPSGDAELADALTDLQSILDSAARRHSSPEAVALMDKADAAYAKFVRIRDAAKSRGGEAAEFSPTQFDRSVQRNTAGRYSDAYLRGDALMQDYAQQGMALVDRIPNSGSAERIFTGMAATGAAGGMAAIEPNTLGVLGIIGSLYAPGLRKVVAGSMAPRGPKAKAVADAVRKRARIAGATGAGVALSAQKDDDR